MNRDDMADLTAFVAVAEEQSFTRASKRLGLSQSALSQIVRRLEERLGLRLLSRTTRSVSPTDVGERLMAKLSPMLRDLDDSIASLSDFKDKPAGSIRITTVEHAAQKYIMPALGKILPDHPDIKVEVEIDYGLTDIVEAKFDAGVRLGEQVEKDMIAVRISPDIPMAIFASPEYFERNAPPTSPHDLRNHRCITLRLPTWGDVYEWKLTKRGKSVHVRLEGQVTLNAVQPIQAAALAGLGIANLPLDLVEDQIQAGALVRVLSDWSEELPGYHLYYPNRRHSSPAFKLLVDALRYRA